MSAPDTLLGHRSEGGLFDDVDWRRLRLLELDFRPNSEY
jgi:hypothetical protein